MQRDGSSLVGWGNSAWRWMVGCAIAAVTALVAVFILFAIQKITTLKLEWLQEHILFMRGVFSRPLSALLEKF